MKKLYLIGGAMGIGKTTACNCLNKRLPHSVFLDGDWCWNANPFTVTDETKAMVMSNIRFMLNSFIHCSVYENIIFCWVMHRQEIIGDIISGLDVKDVEVVPVSLICDEKTLTSRLSRDVAAGVRASDVISRSLSYLPLYAELDTVKIDVSDLSAEETAVQIENI